MPLKKATGKKKKVGVKKSKSKDDGGPLHLKKANVDELGLVKEFFLLQVADLEARLKRALADYDEVSDKYKKLNSSYTQETENLKDVLEFHKREYGKLTEQLAASKEKFILAERELDERVKTLEKKHVQDRAAFVKQIDGLQNDIHVRDRKLASLDDFRQREAAFQHRLTDMAAQLKEKDEIHRAALEEVERTAMADKEKLRSQLTNRIESVTAAFHRQVLEDMPETTKRILAENVAMNQHIAKLCDQSLELTSVNDTLRKSRETARADLAVAEATEQRQTRRVIVQQQSMQSMDARLKDLEARVSQHTKESSDLRISHEVEINTLKETHSAQITRLTNSISSLKTDLTLTQDELGSARQEIASMTYAMDAAKKSIFSCTQEARVSRTSLLRTSIDHIDSPAYVAAAADLERTIVVLQAICDSLDPPSLGDAVYEPGKLGLVPPPKRPMSATTSATTSATSSCEHVSSVPNNIPQRPSSGGIFRRTSRSSNDIAPAVSSTVVVPISAHRTLSTSASSSALALHTSTQYATTSSTPASTSSPLRPSSASIRRQIDPTRAPIVRPGSGRRFPLSTSGIVASASS